MSPNHQDCCAFVCLPRAGLANRLFVWARGHLFSVRNQVPLFVHGWANINLSPIWRGDRSLRFYYPCFEKRTNHCGYIGRKLSSLLGRYQLVDEPSDPSAVVSPTTRTAWLFRGVPWWEDYFVALRGHEESVREGFFDLVKPHVVAQAHQSPRPVLSVHIRRGDFRIARDMTSNEYFVRAVIAIREAANETLPVTVFSDASDDEISDVLSLPETRRHRDVNDVADLITMARSDVIVTSLHSTYGYWAGFLSDAAIILDPRHGAAAIRAPSPARFEGILEDFCDEIDGGRWSRFGTNSETD